MNTTTRDFKGIDANYAAGVVAKVAKLNKRIERIGLEGTIEVALGETDWTEDGPVVDLTLTFTTTIDLGEDFDLVAVLDFAAVPGEVLTHSFGEGDGFAVTDTPDATRCDHCHRAIQRNRVFVLDGAEGQVHVGATCVQDFLGHDPTKVLAYLDALTVLDDEDWEPPADLTFPTLSYVAAAAAAYRSFGWTKATGGGDDTPTKMVAVQILNGRLDADERRFMAQTIANQAVDPDELAEAAIAWAAELEPNSDFDASMQTIARTEWITERAFGVAAYIPVAYERHMARQAEKAAAEADAGPAEDAPVDQGRVEVTGEILSTEVRENEYGVRVVWVVRDDRGFKVWGTIPSAIRGQAKAGDRVTFTAGLEASDDPKFAFTKRPTKAAILAEEVAA